MSETLEQMAYRLEGSLAHQILNALREVEARHDCAEECACFRRGLAAVTTIRCSKHYGVPQQNKTECAGPSTGGECGGCIAERAEKAEADLRDIIENDEGQRERANRAEAENVRLREALTAAQVRANEATVLVGLYRQCPAEPKP